MCVSLCPGVTSSQEVSCLKKHILNAYETPHPLTESLMVCVPRETINTTLTCDIPLSGWTLKKHILNAHETPHPLTESLVVCVPRVTINTTLTCGFPSLGGHLCGVPD